MSQISDVPVYLLQGHSERLSSLQEQADSLQEQADASNQAVYEQLESDKKELQKLQQSQADASVANSHAQQVWFASPVKIYCPNSDQSL